MDRLHGHSGGVEVGLRCSGTRQGARVGCFLDGVARGGYPAGRASVALQLCRIGRHRAYVCGRMLDRARSVVAERPQWP